MRAEDKAEVGRKAEGGRPPADTDGREISVLSVHRVAVFATTPQQGWQPPGPSSGPSSGTWRLSLEREVSPARVAALHLQPGPKRQALLPWALKLTYGPPNRIHFSRKAKGHGVGSLAQGRSSGLWKSQDSDAFGPDFRSPPAAPQGEHRLSGPRVAPPLPPPLGHVLWPGPQWVLLEACALPTPSATSRLPSSKLRARGCRASEQQAAGPPAPPGPSEAATVPEGVGPGSVSEGAANEGGPGDHHGQDPQVGGFPGLGVCGEEGQRGLPTRYGVRCPHSADAVGGRIDSGGACAPSQCPARQARPVLAPSRRGTGAAVRSVSRQLLGRRAPGASACQPGPDPGGASGRHTWSTRVLTGSAGKGRGAAGSTGTTPSELAGDADRGTGLRGVHRAWVQTKRTRDRTDPGGGDGGGEAGPGPEQRSVDATQVYAPLRRGPHLRREQGAARGHATGASPSKTTPAHAPAPSRDRRGQSGSAPGPSLPLRGPVVCCWPRALGVSAQRPSFLVTPARGAPVHVPGTAWSLTATSSGSLAFVQAGCGEGAGPRPATTKANLGGAHSPGGTARLLAPPAQPPAQGLLRLPWSVALGPRVVPGRERCGHRLGCHKVPVPPRVDLSSHGRVERTGEKDISVQPGSTSAPGTGRNEAFTVGRCGAAAWPLPLKAQGGPQLVLEVEEGASLLGAQATRGLGRSWLSVARRVSPTPGGLQVQLAQGHHAACPRARCAGLLGLGSGPLSTKHSCVGSPGTGAGCGRSALRGLVAAGSWMPADRSPVGTARLRARLGRMGAAGDLGSLEPCGDPGMPTLWAGRPCRPYPPGSGRPWPQALAAGSPENSSGAGVQAAWPCPAPSGGGPGGDRAVFPSPRWGTCPVSHALPPASPPGRCGVYRCVGGDEQDRGSVDPSAGGAATWAPQVCRVWQPIHRGEEGCAWGSGLRGAPGARFRSAGITPAAREPGHRPFHPRSPGLTRARRHLPQGRGDAALYQNGASTGPSSLHRPS
ncbi:collagen alpha-1(I) chain-like [Hippopotamus amphibius kiboko]|uniref:collagen alpha-1(I) chain-like n=1 Tax=Hippopotamus amphibius kiboko TaxID=575201 RepID=UPI002592FBC1|nr:collagen alpha-1(I) chain-like [Hippopotamus amphibius kiboko]